MLWWHKGHILLCLGGIAVYLFCLSRLATKTDPSTISELTTEQHHEFRLAVSQDVHRECALSKEIVTFQFNLLDGKYHRYTGNGQTQNNDTAVFSGGWQFGVNVNASVVSKGTSLKNPGNRFLKKGGNTTTGYSENITLRTFVQDHGAVLEARACWCAEAYFHRPMEYCPIDYDTCLVRGFEGLVSCYRNRTSGGFLSNIWPLAIGWLVSLVYATSCTDNGRFSQQYLRRGCVWWRRWCLVGIVGSAYDPDAEELALLERDLDQLLENQPEHAAFLYRQAVLRFRHYQQSYPLSAARHRRRWVANRSSPNSSLSGSNDSEDDINSVETPRDVLLLRTKVFGETDRSRRRVTEESWRPPFLASPDRRDQITFDQMDDQLEQGVRCSICLVRLEAGDMIGDLPCGHAFHKECIKSWLAHANRCPLCQQSGVATLRQLRPGTLSQIY